MIQQLPLRSRQLRVLLQLDRLTDLIVEILQRAFERGNLGSVPGSGVSDGGVSVPDVRGPSRESLW
ncbi:hypothetical protein [Mycobacterium avium]|uniref:hypothetical protein n=1 Tax=Mycobacterium avium TaxID=1764 RepID=UPI003C308627